MQTIDLDNDIYDFLLKHTSHFGETPSDVLRRLLSFPAHGKDAGRSTNGSAKPVGSTNGKNSIEKFLNSPAFLVNGNAISRFLSLLSWLHDESHEKFEEVLRLNGRKRRYFAHSAEELEASGNSVMPKRIPNTRYWVVSNMPNQLKKQVLADAMRMLGYDSSFIQAAVQAIR
jgi:negative modulator of initiation of replication